MALWALPTKAQTAPSSAPYVFMGQTLAITEPDFQSNLSYQILEPARIDVADGASAHISGVVSNVSGSPYGLTKLGAGALRLSGDNTYRGTTLLLQGELHAGGGQAFGVGAVQANTGTLLGYAPGVVMRRPVLIEAVDLATVLPPGSYAPVSPPAGYEDVVRWRVPEGQARHAGLLQGAAPFVKLGQGLLDISGDALGYTGQATVAQGGLAVNELFGGSVTVQGGAVLQGTGTVGALRVLSGGMLAPGNSMGTLSVAGDAVFQAGSRFVVEADASGGADMLHVGGKALLDGELRAVAAPGDWKPTTQYVVLQADGGLDNTRFASASSSLPFLSPRLSYGETAVVLTLVRNDTPLDDAAETPDEEDVADAVDEPGQPSGPGGAPPKANPGLNDGVAGLDEPTAREALRQLSGSWAASVLSSVLDDSCFVRQAVLRRAAVQGGVFEGAAPGEAGNGSASALARLGGTGAWAQAFYSSADRNGHDGVPGDARSLHGLLLGLDAPVGGQWTASVFAGAQRSRLDRVHGLAQARIDTTHLGTGVWRQGEGGWRLAAGVAHSWHIVRSQRTIAAGTLRDALGARYRGRSLQVFGEVGWPLRWAVARPAEAGGAVDADSKRGGQTGRPVSLEAAPTPMSVGLEPFARLAWVRARLDGFTEKGGPAALDVRAASARSWLGALGLRAAATVAGAVPGGGQASVYAQAAWHYAGNPRVISVQRFRDSATQTVFSSHGLPLARRAWSLEVGMDAGVGKGMRVGFGYVGRVGGGVSDHGVGGWGRVVF